MGLVVPIFFVENLVVDLEKAIISLNPSSVVIPLLVVANPVLPYKILVPVGPEAVVSTISLIVPVDFKVI